MTDFNFEQASYGDLFAHAKQLDNALRMTQTALANRERQRLLVSSAVQELIENGTISDEEAIEIFVENLDINLTRVVNFTITMEITGSLELPYGEQVSEYNFEVEQLSYDGNYIEVDSSNVTDLEWDFNE